MKNFTATNLITAAFIAASVAALAPSAAHAQNPEIKFKDYTEGYAKYYYPEVCSFNIEKASQPAAAPAGGGSISGAKGKVSFSCPTGQPFKKYSFGYGSGNSAGKARDNVVQHDHPADGKKNTLEVSYTPGGCIYWAVAACTEKAWTNVKIVPIY
ncbi:MAG: hypothetical protein ACRC20_17605 [Segniliparus sp.]|uniref:hypothetical protein n=1 Tax=Segniliparus sp. TaxID=2804064 RepID=UPI003F4121CA